MSEKIKNCLMKAGTQKGQFFIIMSNTTVVTHKEEAEEETNRLRINTTKHIDKIVRFVYNNSTKKGSGTMSITATELKNNLSKYLLLSATEDILITKNGKVVAKLVNPYQNRVEMAKSLFGILPKDADADEARAERLNAK